jgi:hypothetical protein
MKVERTEYTNLFRGFASSHPSEPNSLRHLNAYEENRRQEEVANKSGVAASTIRETKRGESTPRTDTNARVGKLLGFAFAGVWSLQRRRE